MGTLYVVGLPLGRPDDVTLRALRVVRGTSLVVAGDVQQARQFLDQCGIDIPASALSPPGDSQPRPCAEALSALEAGDVALLHDEWSLLPSGPACSLIRAAVERGFSVTPVPGPIEPLAALVISGLPADSFLYLGCLSATADWPVSLLAAERRTLVAREAPDRLAGTLDRLHTALGDRRLSLVGQFADWQQCVWRGMIAVVDDHLAAHPPLGECVLVIGGIEGAPARWEVERLQAEIQARLDRGQGAAEIGQRLAIVSGWPRRQVYGQVIECQKESVKELEADD